VGNCEHGNESFSSKEDGEFLHLSVQKWTLIHVEQINHFHIITLLQGYERKEARAEFCEASERGSCHPELVKIADALSGNGLDGCYAYSEKVKCDANDVSFL
jgi:hypothetical protein